jgi:NAD(P)-dependent dehydrogenase (short-subunit alcohol dehydrogenase family)
VSALAGEIAVVTGAAQGIGEAVALALAGAGARVAVTSWDRERAVATAERLGGAAAGHAGFSLDIASTASVDAAAAAIAETLGTPTILVNSAGINRIGPAELFSDEDWEHVLDVNLTGTYRCCRAFGLRMLAAGRGSIVNIASIAGPVTALPGRAPYAASKAGIVGLTRVLAIEWAARGVRVNAVLPGPVRTPMVLAAISRGILDEGEIVARTPAGRLAEPVDIAGAVVLLCGQGAGFVTGQSLVVDGGYTMFGAAHEATRIPGRPVDA